MIQMKVKYQNRVGILHAAEDETIMQALKREDILLAAPCYGMGFCKKCKVKVHGKEVLACQTKVEDNMEVELISTFCSMSVLDAFLYEEQEQVVVEHGYYVAIDLGTTTLVLQLIQAKEDGEKHILQTVKAMNEQSVLGADVISRITASNAGERERLQHMILNQISQNIDVMCTNAGIKVEEVTEVVIAGNTTMIHLLLGWDTKNLGRYPFEPVSLEWQEYTLGELIGNELQTKVTIFPGFSAFVGGDITAGLYALDFAKKNEVNLFLDFGTNGEMAIGNKEKILVTSTAAGPAFEGGNLSCGVGAISGAIKEVKMKPRYFTYQTIDNQPAIGICGSGVVDLIAELGTNQYMDEHGTLKEMYREGIVVATTQKGAKKEVRFLQEDVRQMQLAKAAIRSGIEILMQTYGVEEHQIKHLYLAGGMGFSLNIENACQIGLIPEELKERVVSVGNSCLGGVYQYLGQGKQEREKVDAIKEVTTHLQLAEKEQFSNEYLKYMDFNFKRK